MSGAGGRLAGRVAVVTGASRGIGASIAQLFAAEGAKVSVLARTVEPNPEGLPGSAQEVVDAIRGAGGEAIAVRCDVTDDDQRVAAIERTRQELGPVSILVNNAAVTATPKRGGRPQASAGAAPIVLPTVAALPLKAFRIHFEVNVFASYRFAQLTLPDMIEARRGWIVNISSYASHMPGPGPYTGEPSPNLAGYGGSKAALEHLTLCTAYDMAPHGIAVNALMPSFALRTPGLLATSGGYDDAPDPSEFAQAALVLADADPAVTTGQVHFHDDVLHPERPPRGWTG